MNLSDTQARLAHDLILEAVLHRQRYGQPIPERVRGLLAFMSARGRPVEPPAPRLVEQDSARVNTAQAAEILGCSTRHVRRLHADIGGQKIGCDWWFERTTVADYARERRCPTTSRAA